MGAGGVGAGAGDGPVQDCPLVQWDDKHPHQPNSEQQVPSSQTPFPREPSPHVPVLAGGVGKGVAGGGVGLLPPLLTS